MAAEDVERLQEVECGRAVPASTVGATQCALCESRAVLQDHRDITKCAEQESGRTRNVHDKATDVAQLALRQTHNAHIRVASLPPEILSTIFTYLCGIDPPKKLCATDYQSTATFGWLSVTYVSRRWRQVAHTHSHLWAHIDFAFGSDWAATFGVRARTIPLLIKSLDTPLSPWQVEFVVENMPRTQSLCIPESEHVFTRLIAPAPLLQALDLHVPDHTNPFPDNFLGGCAPMLRHLRLFSGLPAHQPWGSPLLTNLVSLALQFIPEDATELPVDDILDVLARMHALERLKIELLLTTEELQQINLPTTTARIVSLPNLRYLELFTTFQDGRVFLTHLALSPHASVHCMLYSNELPRQAEELEAFYPVALSSFKSYASSASGGSNTITKLEAMFTDESDLNVSTWRDDGTPILSILLIDNDEWPADRLVPIALKALSSARLKELTVSFASASQDIWTDWLQLVPALQKLTVCGSDIHQLCAALRQPAASGVAEPDRGNASGPPSRSNSARVRREYRQLTRCRYVWPHARRRDVGSTS